ncbi:hypothetical protein MAPG_04110 [Magnaporthiopsis poae ATCC 64411]|uniref:Uncharacterized protein n=1 Tax=Magnaporthiopsis poae (strain ATCC 64411 / 73-15) TaxID=644358 RepID=A0A0C4DVU7_MAGP6|nr:hypothetical protein MAPG_04110 [Magnaporthiopsis poae ATCC 64411]
MPFLEGLNREVILGILEAIDSPIDLKSFVLSSKDVHNAFRRRSDAFYYGFAIRMDTSPLFHELRDTLDFCDRPGLEQVPSHLFWCLSKARSGPSSPYQNKIFARSIFHLVDKVDRLGYEFFRRSAPLFFDIHDANISPFGVLGSCRNTPSFTELYRLRRAFFRYQLYCETIQVLNAPFKLSDLFDHLRP